MVRKPRFYEKELSEFIDERYLCCYNDINSFYASKVLFPNCLITQVEYARS